MPVSKVWEGCRYQVTKYVIKTCALPGVQVSELYLVSLQLHHWSMLGVWHPVFGSLVLGGKLFLKICLWSVSYEIWVSS